MSNNNCGCNQSQNSCSSSANFPKGTILVENGCGGNTAILPNQITQKQILSAVTLPSGEQIIGYNPASILLEDVTLPPTSCNQIKGCLGINSTSTGILSITNGAPSVVPKPADTVSNEIVAGQLITTVNAVSSQPITLSTITPTQAATLLNNSTQTPLGVYSISIAPTGVPTLVLANSTNSTNNLFFASGTNTTLVGTGTAANPFKYNVEFPFSDFIQIEDSFFTLPNQLGKSTNVYIPKGTATIKSAIFQLVSKQTSASNIISDQASQDTIFQVIQGANILFSGTILAGTRSVSITNLNTNLINGDSITIKYISGDTDKSIAIKFGGIQF